jgi:predicted methyltransferase
MYPSVAPETAPVLSHVQAEALLHARRDSAPRTSVSLDLGLSTVELLLDVTGIQLPSGASIGWADIERVADEQAVCFVVTADGIEPIRVYSETTNWVRSLYPTSGAPTMLVSGITMHRVKGIDPRADTLRKVRAIAPLTGRVLDIATGLGYTAIEAATTAEQVVTIELDPAALEVARLNPWSRDLFENPRITQIVGDAYDEIAQFEAGSFTRIIHDPPALSLAGELYSAAFYRELRRVLARNGRVFHYIGDPESPSGRSITRGVIQRLQAAGFGRVTRRPEAFGVVAFP